MSMEQFFSHSTTALNTYQAYSSSAVSSVFDPVVFVRDSDKNVFRPEDEGRYSVFDIADWFLSKAELTHKKLQKLCYYAQAWCFALNGYRLETTDYQAWVHGPVSPALWDRFKSFGYAPIKYNGKSTFPFAPEDLKLLQDVWDTYGEQSGNSLEALTHRELPWLEARKGYEPDEKCSVTISPASMASFYKSIYSGG